MDIIAFSKTLAVLLTVIQCQFAEGMSKYAVVGSRIDLYCETEDEFGVDWVFKNHTGTHNIYRDKIIPQKFVDRYSVTVKSNKTTILSAEKADSTYAGTYECVEGHDQSLLRSLIRLIIITPTLCNANGNVYAVGNTSHELYCSFTIDRNNSSDDRWPTELCANGAQWQCQILSSHTDDDPLYFGCSANAKLFTDHALKEGRPSLLIDASHQCASTSFENASTSTISASMTLISHGDKQILIIVCAAVGGFTLLTILSVALLSRRRNCWKRRRRGRTDNTHKNDTDRQNETHHLEELYQSIDDNSPGWQPESPLSMHSYAEVSREPRRLMPSSPDPIYSYSDKKSILKKATNRTVDADIYAEAQKVDCSTYSMCTA